MMGYFGYGNGMSMFGGLGMLILVGLAILGILALLRHYNEPGHSPLTGPAQQRPDEALRIARERLARGELSLEEFESIKRSLT